MKKTTKVFDRMINVKHVHAHTVHPRLSEQPELNLKSGRSDIPKIPIIEDGLFTLFHAPKRSVFLGVTEEKTTAEKKITFCV